MEDERPLALTAHGEDSGGAGLVVPAGGPDWMALVDRFLETGADVNQVTKDTYRKALSQFFRWYVARGGGDIDRSTILAYKNHQLGRLQAGTVSTYLTAVKALFTWLESTKRYPNVAAGIKGVKLTREHRKDALTPQQLNHVLRSLKGETLRAKRDFALFNLMARAGLRSIEVERSAVEDIRNKGASTVLYVHGKGRAAKDQWVVLTPRAVQPIYEYLAARRASRSEVLTPSSALFASLSPRSYGKPLVTRSIRRIVKTSLQSAGFDSDRWTTHSLRHSAVSAALMGGADVQQAQAMARHGDISTTMIYFHNLKRLEDAAEYAVDDILGDI